MTARRWASWIGTAGLGAIVLWAAAARTDEPGDAETAKGLFDQAEVAKSTDLPKPQKGVEPQARGPVHEAFAELARAAATVTPVVHKEPPELIEEMPPAEKPKGDDVQWIGGYWAWDDDSEDFLWVSGIWRVPPPDRQWVPGHWSKAEDGWQWTPGFWAPADEGDVTVVPAPPAQPPANDTPPPPPTNPHSVYVPGCYVPHEQGYVWRPACYVEPRPGWVYVPAHYCPCATGYVFVEGYWDYALRDRGLLFAPAVIAVEYRTQPNFVYTPCYVVHDQALLGALFVHQGGGYFFGDYFGASYTRLGYSSVVDIRIGSGYDPLFGYYRYENRGNPYWERNLSVLYAQRRLGAIPPPPRTLALQQQAIGVGFGSGGTSVNLSFVKQNVLLAPVGRVNPAVVPIQTLPPAQVLAQQRRSQEIRQVALQRQQAEARLLAQQKEHKGPKPGADVHLPPPPQKLALNLPKPPEKTVEFRKAPPPKPPVHVTPPDAKIIPPPQPKVNTPPQLLVNPQHQPPPVVVKPPPVIHAPPPPPKKAPPPPPKKALPKKRPK